LIRLPEQLLILCHKILSKLLDKYHQFDIRLRLFTIANLEEIVFFAFELHLSISWSNAGEVFVVKTQGEYEQVLIFQKMLTF